MKVIYVIAILLICGSPITTYSQSYDEEVIAYVVPKNLRSGIITGEHVQNTTEVVYLKAESDTAGNPFMTIPDNDGTLTNTTFVNTTNPARRSLDFSGVGAKVNCGKGLLTSWSKFTIDLWVYIDTWSNASLFRQGTNTTSRVSLDLVAAPNNVRRLQFQISNGSTAYAAVDNAFDIGGWHHIAVAYNGASAAFNQTSIYIDGVKQSPWYSNLEGRVATSTPSERRDFILGDNLDGKIDEIRVLEDEVTLITDIARLKNEEIYDANATFETKVDFPFHWVLRAAWPVRTTDVQNLEDYVSFKKDLSMIRGYLGNNKKLTIMLGNDSSGNWRTMIKSATARANYVAKIKPMLTTHNLDGVSLDFEWPNTTAEWNGLNQLIVDFDTSLSNDKIIGHSLQPFVFGQSCCSTIPQTTLNAIDFLALQSYDHGTNIYNPNHASYAQFLTDIQTFKNKGFTDGQIVAGVPFYGSPIGETFNQQPYINLFNANPNIDESTDYAVFNGNIYYFNNISTIKRKVTKIKEDGLGGVMIWALGMDLPYNNPKSLLRTIDETLKQTATQSSTEHGGVASRAIDGNTDGNWANGSVTHTTSSSQPWWQVDLGFGKNIDKIKIYNRTDCCAERLTDYHVFVSDVPFTSNTVSGTQSQTGVTDFHNTGQAGTPSTITVNRTGRYVRVQLSGTGILSLAEVQVLGSDIGSSSTSLMANIGAVDIGTQEEETLLDRLVISPNPVSRKQILQMDFDNDSENRVTLLLSNFSGQVVQSRSVNLVQGHNRVQLGIGNLVPGIYVVTLTGKEVNISRKIIVK